MFCQFVYLTVFHYVYSCHTFVHVYISFCNIMIGIVFVLKLNMCESMNLDEPFYKSHAGCVAKTSCRIFII